MKETRKKEQIIERDQKQLQEKIKEIAKNNKLTKNGYQPIPDGIGNIHAYVDAPLKVMWILKEAYDKDKQGNKGKGGWPIYEAFDKDTAWSYLTFQRMSYIMYGFQKELHYGDKKMPAIKKCKEMVQVLKSIAYININKMPGDTHSSDKKIRDSYSIWSELINEQIEKYNPDVIVFGGTERFYEFTDELKEIKNLDPELQEHNKILYGKKVKRWVISVNHPGYRRDTGTYVDLVIDSLKKANEWRHLWGKKEL